MQYDLSYNNLSGPLILPGVASNDQVMTTLNLAMTRGLECPIRLAEMGALRTLDLRGAGFDGCDFGDQSMVQLPQTSLKELDVSGGDSSGAWRGVCCVGSCAAPSPPNCPLLTPWCHGAPSCPLFLVVQISHNDWLPMILPIYSNLIRVSAIRASVHSLSFQAILALQELVLDHSLIRPPPPSHQSQTGVFEDICQWAPSLRYLSCNNCSLQVDRTNSTHAAFQLALLVNGQHFRWSDR